MNRSEYGYRGPIFMGGCCFLKYDVESILRTDIVSKIPHQTRAGDVPGCGKHVVHTSLLLCYNHHQSVKNIANYHDCSRGSPSHMPTSTLRPNANW